MTHWLCILRSKRFAKSLFNTIIRQSFSKTYNYISTSTNVYLDSKIANYKFYEELKSLRIPIPKYKNIFMSLIKDLPIL